MNNSSKGVVLKHLGGEGPVEIMTRVTDFNVQQIQGPDGKTVEFPANTLVAFTAQKFRELGDSDEWEFVTLMPSPTGQPVRAYIYLSGRDIFMVRAISKVG
jgi:hypothetical protein